MNKKCETCGVQPAMTHRDPHRDVTDVTVCYDHAKERLVTPNNLLRRQYQLPS